MAKIAVLDDDERWGFAVQRYLRSHFEVAVYTDIRGLMRSQQSFDLIIVDFTLLPTHEFETIVNGCELIRYLKQTSDTPPLAVLASGYISCSDLEDSNLFRDASICAEADLFLAKDAGLDVILQQVQLLLSSRPAV